MFIFWGDKMGFFDQVKKMKENLDKYQEESRQKRIAELQKREELLKHEYKVQKLESRLLSLREKKRKNAKWIWEL